MMHLSYPGVLAPEAVLSCSIFKSNYYKRVAEGMNDLPITMHVTCVIQWSCR